MAVVVGHHNPYVSIVLIAPISFWFWTIYFRYLYLLLNIYKYERVLIQCKLVNEKRICSLDGKRVYIDCLEATFGSFLPFLVHRQKRAEVKSRLRKGLEVEAYRLGSAYVVHKGSYSLLPLLFPVISTLFLGLIVLDIIEDLSG